MTEETDLEGGLDSTPALSSQVWRWRPAIPALGRPRQKDQGFERGWGGGSLCKGARSQSWVLPGGRRDPTSRRCLLTFTLTQWMCPTP